MADMQRLLQNQEIHARVVSWYLGLIHRPNQGKEVVRWGIAHQYQVIWSVPVVTCHKKCYSPLQKSL